MWLTKLRLKHDCIIGNRCRKYGVTTLGTPFNVYIDNGVTYSPQVQTLYGSREKIAEFIRDLKKDKKVTNLETEGNTVFLIEVQKKQKVTASVYSQLSPKIIFVNPVFVDKDGYEYWEVASWKKSILSDFITGIRKEVTEDLEVKKIEQAKVQDVHYPQLSPKLSENQKLALNLAVEHGFYSWPKKTSLTKLAKLVKISVPTFREHLKKAESKVIPNKL